MGMRSKKILFLLILVFCLNVQSKELSDAQIYRRCYFHLIGESPMLNDSNLMAIQNKQKTALQACQNLLDRMRIDPNDSLGRLIDPNDTVALSGLRNIYRVTNGFIKTKRLEGAITNFFEDFASAEDIMDTTAVALAYTENILNDQKEFKELFSISKTPRASRALDPMYENTFIMKTVYPSQSPADLTKILSPRSRHGQAFFGNPERTVAVNPDNVPIAIENSPMGTYTDQPLSIIQVGELNGITYNYAPESISRSPNTYGLMNLGFDIQSNISKGLIGLRPYIAANTNWSDNLDVNLEYMHRRLSQSIVRDFLCRDLPVVRESDILKFVSNDPNANAFRKASSCVKCHATIDQMAGSFRDLKMIKSGDRSDLNLKRFIAMPHKINPQAVAAESGWPALKDNLYHRRPTKGVFYFRSYDGKLFSNNLTNMSSLSDAIATTDDVYICFAKKMFKHFTGIDVKMFDAGDSVNAEYMSTLTPTDWAYRNFVIKAGLNLKQHQKPKNLIKEIISSPFYKSSNMGKE